MESTRLALMLPLGGQLVSNSGRGSWVGCSPRIHGLRWSIGQKYTSVIGLGLVLSASHHWARSDAVPVVLMACSCGPVQL